MSNITLTAIEMIAESTQESIGLPRQSSPKKVDFSPRVTVVLIPERKEYEKAQLNDQLWWNHEDYSTFKHNALNELRLLRTIQPSTSLLTCPTGQTVV
jgi:hypothetical protein